MSTQKTSKKKHLLNLLNGLATLKIPLLYVQAGGEFQVHLEFHRIGETEDDLDSIIK